MFPVGGLIERIADGDVWAADHLTDHIDAEATAAAMTDALWLKYRRGAPPWATHRGRTSFVPPTIEDIERMVGAADMLDDRDVWS